MEVSEERLRKSPEDDFKIEAMSREKFFKIYIGLYTIGKKLDKG